MSTQPPTRTALDEALTAHAEAVRLRAELAGLRQEEAALREGAVGARESHEKEARDVERLEGPGLASLVASLRGSRAEDLHRERAEESTARDRARTALARLQTVEARAEAVDRRLAVLGDTGAAREQAVAAHADTVRASGSPVAPELDAVCAELETTRGQVADIERARAAGVRAAASLEIAARRLSSAGSWSTYDTFAGGGMLASSVKHHHAEEASRSIAAAQHDLVEFASALRDPGALTGLRADLGVGGLTRGLDIWFDNLVTDWSVRSRIKDAAGRVDAALAAVREALGTTSQRLVGLHERVEELRARRDELVGA